MESSTPIIAYDIERVGYIITLSIYVILSTLQILTDYIIKRTVAAATSVAAAAAADIYTLHPYNGAPVSGPHPVPPTTHHHQQHHGDSRELKRMETASSLHNNNNMTSGGATGVIINPLGSLRRGATTRTLAAAASSAGGGGGSIPMNSRHHHAATHIPRVNELKHRLHWLALASTLTMCPLIVDPQSAYGILPLELGYYIARIEQIWLLIAFCEWLRATLSVIFAPRPLPSWVRISTNAVIIFWSLSAIVLPTLYWQLQQSLWLIVVTLIWYILYSILLILGVTATLHVRRMLIAHWNRSAVNDHIQPSHTTTLANGSHPTNGDTNTDVVSPGAPFSPAMGTLFASVGTTSPPTNVPTRGASIRVMVAPAAASAAATVAAGSSSSSSNDGIRLSRPSNPYTITTSPSVGGGQVRRLATSSHDHRQEEQKKGMRRLWRFLTILLIVFIASSINDTQLSIARWDGRWQPTDATNIQRYAIPWGRILFLCIIPIIIVYAWIPIRLDVCTICRRHHDRSIK
jgi:hypothetical protein